MGLVRRSGTFRFADEVPFLRLLCPSFEVTERSDDVLQTVHVVPVDEPVPDVAEGLVLHVPDMLGHDRSRDVHLMRDSLLQHRDLKLAQNLVKKRTKRRM